MEFACFQRNIIISVGCGEGGAGGIEFFRGINIFRRCNWLNFSMGVTFFRRTEIFKGGGGGLGFIQRVRFLPGVGLKCFVRRG